MALFQKNPQETSKLPLYTLGTNKNVLIIGLGNPGKEYVGTRHNIGFSVIEEFARNNNFPAWISKKDLKVELSVKTLGENRVILAKPATFMNLSGQATSAVQKFYRVYNLSTLVIYDELAIPFGQLRTRVGGGDAGHNGVKSLIQHIGEDFGRLRIGIGNEISEKADASDFVLSKFTKEEQGNLPLILSEASNLITEYIYSGQLPHDTRTILS
ncbi:aminoacyl-tRNA hydrolase [Candidatus Saccharibacteria bacterium]|nr:aminoacyl-tRNA hydrolase [Candidatus Saccharibacteria bacterium]